MKRKIKVQAEIDCGSDFQYSVLGKSMTAIMLALKEQAERHHKQNKVTFEVK